MKRKRRELRRWKTWAVVDLAGVYQMTIHQSRRDAQDKHGSFKYLEDAKWQIVRVEVRELRKRK